MLRLSRQFKQYDLHLSDPKEKYKGRVTNRGGEPVVG